MAKEKNMAELADLFHVSASALRYWEHEGLIRFGRTPHNRYRQPSAQTMWDLCEVLFYRNLSVPIADMKRMPSLRVEQMQQMLDEHEQSLRRRIAEMEGTIARIRGKQEAIARIDELRKGGLTPTWEKLDGIDAFAFEKTMMQDYIHTPDCAAVVITSASSLQIRYGVFGHREAQERLKPADTGARMYIKGLLRIQSDDTQTHSYKESVRQGYERFARAVRAQGGRPGALYGRYLLSACETVRYDYYQAWMVLDTNAASGASPCEKRRRVESFATADETSRRTALFKGEESEE